MRYSIGLSNLIFALTFASLPVAASATTANYPKESLKAGEEGRVGFIVEITETGKPVNCRVNESSGFPRLGRATCEQVEKYARFAPAVDGAGKPIRGEYSGKINWVIGNK